MKTFLMIMVSFLSWSARAEGGHTYSCAPLRGSEAGAQNIEIALNEEKLVVRDFLPSPNGSVFSYDRDFAFKSKGLDKIRYGKRWNYVVVSDSLLIGGEQLRNGKRGGFAEIGGSEDGGWTQSKYICFLQTQPTSMNSEF